MQPQKKSLALPISVGIVLPIVLLVFTGIFGLLKNFILGDIGSSPTTDTTNSGLSGIIGIFVIIGVVWVVVGIVWTIMAKQKYSK